MIETDNRNIVQYGDLMNEACLIHQAVFKDCIPQYIADKYVEAHDYYITDTSVTDLLWMKRALRLGLDLESLEIVMRIINKDHILVRKFKILIYICESFPAYYNIFINENPKRTKAFAILCYHGVRSAYKLLKGTCLYLRYGKLLHTNV